MGGLRLQDNRLAYRVGGFDKLRTIYARLVTKATFVLL